MTASRYLSIHPAMFFCAVVLLLWAGTMVGRSLRHRRQSTLGEESSTFKTLESAVLALLGLLLGFTFSMSVSRYDQRKTLEIAEANDVAALWVRADATPEPLRSTLHESLRQYIAVRLMFLDAGTSTAGIDRSLQQTEALQAQMGAALSGYMQSHTDAVAAQLGDSLADVVGVAESRTAAFENRIPITAWIMLLFISLIASMLVGVGISSRSPLLGLILPVVVAAALSLTLDLDSPRSGLIRVHQRSLERVKQRIDLGRMP